VSALVGVLALQGAFDAHRTVVGALGFDSIAVRSADEFDDIDVLILPGGESSAMLRLMEAEGLEERLRRRIGEGLPTLATCAGVILLARTVSPVQRSLGLLDVDVERNAYGRQLHSSVERLDLADSVRGRFEGSGVFIRAPRITRTGSSVEVLARRGDDPVLVRSGAILAATFHPELSGDTGLHRYFLEDVAGSA